MTIQPLSELHYPEVNRIYLEGIATGNATFETESPSWEKWDAGHLQHSRLVALDNDKVIGWAALSPVSERRVYVGVAEVSVYISASHRGKGVGGKLLRELISSSEANNMWTLTAGIFPENEASVALHKKHGFRIIGTRERVGKMNGVWRDTVQLERRSGVVGME
ncbi:MAG: N-acetyltransferase family protein [Bacteroidota bacterium]